MRSRRLVTPLTLAGIVLVLYLGHDAELGPMASFRFQAPGEPPLLVLRCGLLFFALSALRDAPGRALGVVVLFLVSLAIAAGLLPFTLACAVVVAIPRRADGTAHLVLFGSLAVALALGIAAHVKAPSLRPSPEDPAAMVAYWQLRKNPFEARRWAVVWTHSEAGDPGDGYLALAAIDHDLGRDEQARKVVAKILEHGSNDGARARAASLRASWGAEKPAEP